MVLGASVARVWEGSAPTAWCAGPGGGNLEECSGAPSTVPARSWCGPGRRPAGSPWPGRAGATRPRGRRNQAHSPGASSARETTIG